MKKINFNKAVSGVLALVMVLQFFIFADYAKAAGANVTVDKIVTGGSKTASDFIISIKDSSNTDIAGSPFPGADMGAPIALPSGTYTISQTAPNGYTNGDFFCGDSGINSFTIVDDAQSTLCTSISTYQSGNLLVKKEVVGSTAPASDFEIYVFSDTFYASSTGSTSGTNYELASGNYTVSEILAPGYTTTYSGDCDSTGVVAVNTGDSKTCTVTNTALTADLAVSAIVDSPTPSVGSTVVYTFSVKNNGPETAEGSKLTAVIPSGLTLVSSTASMGTYDSSTGVWAIGNISSDDTQTITLTFTVNSGTESSTINYPVTTITASQDSVTENNQAQASLTVNSAQNNGGGGSGGGGGTILTRFLAPVVSNSNSQTTPGLVAGAFTDTPSSSTPEPQVLGVSTTLPRTGTASWTYVSFIALLAAGLFVRRKSVLN